ncbi:hypothetical protein AYJ54_39545 [Bradyrhizobium centrolobii]|uniref:Uncharacterized protein n=1 Tax=Bradyrhizobium centrolobii TaxID=1505087 RepID=A0A176Z6Q8_9BRAD|nr:hypothetical protein [Bradyrhizobium centrolobii]OAF15473.1 hypothetical protein AYJ54_39545 [Bradyrhizobium centrolobii]
MVSSRNNAPRRYFVDAVGRRVLIGLTLEETFEFERLDSESSTGQLGRPAARDGDTLWQAAGEQRWLELYEKHEGAWKAWMAQSRAEQPEGFNIY